MPRHDDLLWKVILEDVFDDFLCFLNPDADTILDLNRGFEFLDKELEQLYPPENDEYSPKVIDKLVKVFTKTGQEEWILVHLEVQGQYRKDFPKRMFTYFSRIFDKHQKPVTAYAIFTEAEKTIRPNVFMVKFMGTSLCYTFNTFKISHQSDDDLQASNNPFALVVLTVKTVLAGKKIINGQERDELLLELKIKLAKQLLNKRIAKEKIRALMNFLKYYVRFENPDINDKFEKELEILTERSSTMGIEEFLLDRATKQGEKKGLEKGLEQKSHAVVENLIKELGLSNEQAADIAEVSVEYVAKLRATLKNK